MQGITTNAIILGTGILAVSGNSVTLNGNAISTPISTWSNLTWASTVIWNVQPNVYEDRRILITTGACILAISGLYNGWAGALEVIQSGAGTFGLSLPSGTKVINGTSGLVTLTTGISGAIDTIGFEYNGINLLAAIGNNFS